MATFSAGSASVNIVPDFRGAQKAIGRWFAGMKDIDMPVNPQINQAQLAQLRGAVNAGPKPQMKVDIDYKHFGAQVAKLADTFIGLSPIEDVFRKMFGPKSILMTSGVGALTAIAGAASQAAGALYLLPAGIAALVAPIATLTIGLQGMGDAFKAMASGDIDKINEAMKNLAPNARNFVTEVHSLAPAFKDLRLDIQQELFEGLGERVRKLGETYLPVLHDGLVPIAADWRELASNIIYTLGLQKNVDSVRVILENVHRAFATFAESLAPITQMMIDITTVGSQFLPGMAQSFTDMADAAAAWVAKARETGVLHDIIARALEVLKQLAAILFNVGDILFSVFKAGADAGGNMLSMLEQLTDALAGFLHTDVAQSALGSFFSSLASVIQTLLPGIMSLVQALVVGVLPAIGGLAAAVAPVVNTLLVQLADMITKLAPLFYPALAEAIGAILGALAPLIPVIASIAEALLPVLTDVLARLAPIIAQVAEAFGAALMTVVQMLLPVLPVVADAFFAILDALLPLLPPIMNLIQALLPPLISLFMAIVPVIVQVVQALAPAIAALVEGLTPALKIVAEIVAWAFKEIIGPIITFVINTIVVPLIKLLGLAFEALGAGIKFVFENVIKPIWEGLQLAAQLMWEIFLKPIFTAIGNAWSALWAGVKLVWELVLKPVWDAISAAATWLWNTILKPIWDALGKAWDGLMTGMRWVYDHVLAPMWDLIMKAVGFVKDAFNTAVEGIRTVWDGLKRIAAAPINFIVRTVLRDGLFSAWNWLLDKLGIKALHIDLNASWLQGIPGYATGGQVDATKGGRVPGTFISSYADNVLARLTPNEFVIQEPIARRTRPFLEALNAGQAEAIQAAGGWYATGPTLGYAAGGNVQGALDIVKRLVGTPYVWGGVGPRGVDCSGLQSVVTNALRGDKNPWHRLGTTATFPWRGFASGYGTPYTIGNTKSRGHMAGTLEHHKIESGSGHGAMIDGKALGASSAMFQERGWLNALAGASASSSAAIDKPWYEDLWGSVTGAFNWIKSKIGAVGEMITRFGESPFARWLMEMPPMLVDQAWNLVKDTIANLFLGGRDRETGDVAGIKSDIRAIAGNWGWQNDPQWAAIDWIVGKESSWNPRAQNPRSTASGLFQMIDSTWRAYRPASAGSVAHAKDARANDQGQAGLTYIKDVYGRPTAAKQFHLNNGWYDNGGWLPPGISTIYNGTGRPEPVLTAAEHDALLRWQGGGRVPLTAEERALISGGVHFHGVDERTRTAVMDELWHKLRVARRGGVHSVSGVYSVG